MKSFILLLAMTAAAAAAPAANPLMSKSDNNAPITINSDAFQADLNGKTGTWTGNVVVVQGDMKLRANTDEPTLPTALAGKKAAVAAPQPAAPPAPAASAGPPRNPVSTVFETPDKR